MDDEYGWVDDVPEPDFPVFLTELTTFVLKSPDGARPWAQAQWASRGNPRGQARDLVEVVERSEEGRALVAAWRSTAEIYARPGLAEELSSPLGGEDFGSVPAPD